MQNNQALRFFFHPMSRARTVRWMLEECGASYESVQLEFGASMKAPAYLALNLVFALGYLACGPEALAGAISETPRDRFFDAFFFSVFQFPRGRFEVRPRTACDHFGIETTQAA